MIEILAKSDPPITLKQHIKDGLDVWKHLKQSFPAAEACSHKANFWRLLWLCVVMHDLGKSHPEFQKILRKQENEWRAQRHELLSIPFANQLALSIQDKRLVLRVVAAHHRSYTILREKIASNYESDSKQFQREFEKISTAQALEIANSFGEKLLIRAPDNPIFPLEIIKNYKKEVRKVTIGQQEEITDYFTLLLLMGAFHQCDHLSSAFVTSFDPLLPQHFGFLDRLQDTLAAKGYQFYLHQQEAQKTIGQVILTAPTGSGKTETSMLWLKKQLEETGAGRVFYVLPFTASINAMYERLRHNEKGIGNKMVGMLHGKLSSYLYESFLEEAGNLSELKTQIQEIKQTFKNLETPLKVCTPFQLLKHLFGLKGFEKGIFEWVGGHFIFDEIHAYDPEITAQIIVLLEYLTSRLQAKVFIMTATLPSFLKLRIGQAVGKYTEIQAAPNLYKRFKRHKIQLAEGLLIENLKQIEESLEQNKKVLIVCNTVDQSRTVYEQLANRYSGTLLLHGRFAAKDRTRIEKTLYNQPPQLLIGTQAIEVSLDIDYDVIYTDPAPLDALIQRFGRVNRKREKAPCPCVVFKESNEKDQYIYSAETTKQTLDVLAEIEKKNEGIIQEEELQFFIDMVYPGYDQQAQRRFDLVYNSLTSSASKLFPFEPSEEGEDAYYRQFDGVKVLPAYYEDEYKKALEQFDFIGAEQLKVSIRKGRYASLIVSESIEKHDHVMYPSENPNSKEIRISYLKINKFYRPDTGLNFEEDQYNTSGQYN